MLELPGRFNVYMFLKSLDCFHSIGLCTGRLLRLHEGPYSGCVVASCMSLDITAAPALHCLLQITSMPLKLCQVPGHMQFLFYCFVTPKLQCSCHKTSLAIAFMSAQLVEHCLQDSPAASGDQFTNNKKAHKASGVSQLPVTPRIPAGLGSKLRALTHAFVASSRPKQVTD